MICQEDTKRLKKYLKKVSDELKSLYNETSGDRRVQLLFERLQKELIEEFRLESELVSSRLQYNSSNTELEKLKTDCQSEKSGKQKLEAYCNELQDRHKQIVEEANKSTEEKQESRIKLTKEYQEELNERQRNLEEVCYKRAENMKYNELLKEKIGELIGYVEERDSKFNSLLEEKNKELEEYKEKAETKPSSEEEKLKEELDVYKKKFEDFQNSLTQSNVQFASFKKDMEAKTKLFKNLQKENAVLKKKEEEFKSTLKELGEEVSILRESIKKQENDISKATELKKKLCSDS